jgi:hypothetical protein
LPGIEEEEAPTSTTRQQNAIAVALFGAPAIAFSLLVLFSAVFLFQIITEGNILRIG